MNMKYSKTNNTVLMIFDFTTSLGPTFTWIQRYITLESNNTIGPGKIIKCRMMTHIYFQYNTKNMTQILITPSLARILGQNKSQLNLTSDHELI